MKQYLSGLLMAACFVVLTACGGNDEAVSEAEPEAVATPGAAVETKTPYNPLADEQQAIRDTQSLQGIIDADAEKKKEALEEIE